MPERNLLCPICRSDNLVPLSRSSPPSKFICRSCHLAVASDEVVTKEHVTPPRAFSRPLFYVYAHQILRDKTFHDTNALRNALRTLDYDYLKHLWFCSFSYGIEGDGPLDFEQLERQAKFAERIEIHERQHGELACWVIELPEALYPTEAIYVAIVQNGAGQIQYFTLEKSMDYKGIPQPPMFCEWTEDGRHSNFGPLS